MVASVTHFRRGLELVLLLVLARGAIAQQIPPYPIDHVRQRGGVWHAFGMVGPYGQGCTNCHGQRLGGGSAGSCFVCHSDHELDGGNAKPTRWKIPGFRPPKSPPHKTSEDGVFHAEDKENPYASRCTDCHGPTLYGGTGPSCYQCHEKKWNDSGPASPPLSHSISKSGILHKPGLDDPYGNDCTNCHGLTLDDAFSFVPSCYDCHQEAAGTPHDFSGKPWFNSIDNGCTPCHDWSTWNHGLSSTSDYVVSDSLVANDLGDPTGTSARCLGCHEGTVAVDSYLGRQGKHFVTGSAAFGADLTVHHPVSFTYDSALAAAHGALNDPSTTPSGLPGGGTIAQDMLDDNGQLQCTACHDQHDNTLGNFLKTTPFGGLCFTCHVEFLAVGTRGKHHIPLRDDPWFRGQCTVCHGENLDGVGGIGPACTKCHEPFSFPDAPGVPGMTTHHGGDRYRPYFDCSPCHGDNLEGADYGTIQAPSCNECHADVWHSDNLPPLVDPGGPYSGDVGQIIVFDASATVDLEGDSLTYAWDFGEGHPPRVADDQPIVTHAYSAAGTFNGTLTVCDGYNPPVVVPFVANINAPVAAGDLWSIDTTETPANSFLITIEDHDGALVVFKDDGVNPGVLAIGAESTGVIFWMEIWLDISGGASWGIGTQYFGNIDRKTGTMTGILFSQTGQLASFTGQSLEKAE